jgi:DNA mismatch endonuclease (patch repair protein)
MVDIVDRDTRSRMMSLIRSKHTKPEHIVRRSLHAAGLRFRLHSTDLPGKPDIVLPKFSAVVEVRGCFWHQHASCPFAYMPKSNRRFWKAKLASNVRRDVASEFALRQSGWRVFVIWECQIHEKRALEQLAKSIREHGPTPRSSTRRKI